MSVFQLLQGGDGGLHFPYVSEGCAALLGVMLCYAGGNIGEETHSGRNMAKVVGLTYFGIMAGPAIIGFLTNWIPLNLALGLGSLLCLVVALSAGVLRSEKIR